MASNINTVVVTGNLTREPELRQTPSGASVASLSLANTRSFKRDDEWDEETSFFDVTIWGRHGETVASKADKGDFVTVSGRLKQEKWEDRETGENRYAVKIVAYKVEGDFMFRKASESGYTSVDDDDDIPF